MRGPFLFGLVACVVATSASASAEASCPAVYTRFGITVALPQGWQPIRRKLTPCVDPAERLTVTGRGGLVMLEERLHPARNEFPMRPKRFALRGRPQPMECCAPLGRAGWATTFRDNGRGFYAYVYLGRSGTRAQALAILDGLRVAPLAA